MWVNSLVKQWLSHTALWDGQHHWELNIYQESARFWHSLSLRSPAHSSPRAMENINEGKILTHLRESTFLSKSMSSSRWCPGRVTTLNIFTVTFSCNFLATTLSVFFSPFPHFPFLSNARGLSKPCWSC